MTLADEMAAARKVLEDAIALDVDWRVGDWLRIARAHCQYRYPRWGLPDPGTTLREDQLRDYTDRDWCDLYLRDITERQT